MAAVPTSLLDELTDEVNALSADAQAKVRSALESLLSSWERGGGGDVAALRERAYETIEAVLGYYADTCAAARAAEYYDAVRASQGFPGKYRAVAESMRYPDDTLGAVRYFIGKVVEGAPEVFVSRCVTRVDEEIRRAANRCVAHNARKDPAKPWYARVPRGETCGFCLMLASFGFYAKTEEAAEHSHAHCDCRIVPGFDGVTMVKGYDPDGMYERYNDCLAALGGRDGIASDWYAMPEDEREALVRRHGNKEGKAYTAYLNNRVASEIELRDPSWYAGGEHKGITFTDDAVRRDKVKRWRVDPGERRTAEKLAALGYKTEFWEDEVHLKSENAQGKTTVSRADLSTGIEIKTVYTSKSENTFKSHMKSVANKSGVRFAVFDVSENKSVTDSQAEAWIRKYMKRYGIAEVRMLGHDGSLQTIKK
ncbi:hypothetical protein [Collinsella aerofaciens]|uniref:tRNA nuclease CdiA C-terminal domain-containing protein n=1 Tax=Collinsella aerofaciens TaxID=74426 RepID=A0A6N9JKV8_9ACTN|nr:hypothetical protein [Collinsella aerofaciens]MZJ30312.1 hypothetical protein [Collinsella aerofaciens]MZJ36516.1 hypothetical protein [Collinsella aerofaciens]MZJ39983.1 hypothetical protein [Collinsella aerofaciens]MZJ61950.1 hypothetical protein [Collinsella aerofaciens]